MGSFPNDLDEEDLIDLLVKARARIPLHLDPTLVSPNVDDRRLDTNPNRFFEMLPDYINTPEHRMRAFHAPMTASYPSINVSEPPLSDAEMIYRGPYNRPEDKALGDEIQKLLDPREN